MKLTSVRRPAVAIGAAAGVAGAAVLTTLAVTQDSSGAVAPPVRPTPSARSAPTFMHHTRVMGMPMQISVVQLTRIAARAAGGTVEEVTTAGRMYLVSVERANGADVRVMLTRSGAVLGTAVEPSEPDGRESPEPGEQQAQPQDPGTQDAGTQDAGTQDAGTQDPGAQGPTAQDPTAQDAPQPADQPDSTD